MVQGNFVGHDYFIDCGLGSRSTIRAIFGAYITLWVAIIAACLRSMYRSWIRKKLFDDQPRKPQVSLWSVSPTTTVDEAFGLRNTLVRNFFRGEIFYTLASLACFIVAIIGAASTSIANRTVESNTVSRSALVLGRLVTSEHNSISGATVELTARVQALDQANAPLEQLFDYVPDDASGWIYVGQEWNNTWQGHCSYHLYPALDLHVYSNNSTRFQDEIPLLSKYLPQWATVDPTRQGTDYSGFYRDPDNNGSGAYRDWLNTYVFGSVPNAGDPHGNFPLINISFANLLLHHVGKISSGGFQETLFKSDVHVVECTFNNTVPDTVDQSCGATGNYANAVSNVAEIYKQSVVEAALAEQPVVQPTAMRMLRYWQAFMSVKDVQYLHTKQRTLTVSQPVVQIRLSVLVVTIMTMFLAICAALSMMAWDEYIRSLHIPTSQLDWTVLAACEHRRMVVDWGSSIPAVSPAVFAAQHQDIGLVVSHTPDGRPLVRIVLRGNEPRTQSYHPMSAP